MTKIKTALGRAVGAFKNYRFTKHQQNMLMKLALSLAAFIAAHFFGKPEAPAPLFFVQLFIYLISYFACAYEVLLEAVKKISRGTFFDETILMAVASIGAFALGEFSEGCAVMILYQLGELFQSVAVGRSRNSIRAMMELRPDVAHRVSGGEIEDVDTSELKIGDICVVRPGERVPIDGELVEGVLEADASAITGESLPVTVKPGSRVTSGLINLSGIVRIRATTNDADSTVTRILKIVEDQGANKAESEKLVTKFAKYYTPAVFGLTLIIGVVVPIFDGNWHGWIYKALSLLVVSCPCAFVISVPLTYFGGIGGAGAHGILIKGGSVFDRLTGCRTLMLDKTGTLTSGKLAVTALVPAEGVDEVILKTVAGMSECGSNHPIAKAVIEAVGAPSSAPDDYKELPGLGCAAYKGGYAFFSGSEEFMQKLGIELPETSDTLARRVYFAMDKKYVGAIELADKIKETAYDSLRDIRAAGVTNIGMLSGDRREIAESVAHQLSLDSCYGELKPEDKLNVIRELEANGKKVIFAGDGINDAPTLGEACVGMAMGDVGSDAALEAADAVIMDGRLEKIADAIGIARIVTRIVKENIAFVMTVKLAVLVLTICGLCTMTAAIFADVGVAVIAIVNAMRTLDPNIGNRS